MKLFLITAGFACLVSLGFAFKNNLFKKHKANSSFAVLELFTSEGCSSCPPADNLLPELAKLDANIIPLSFHVDYWNRLGWTDPFSNSEFSARQKEYGKQFNLESIYTPQLIVNGEYELVGSNRNTATTTIKKALIEKAAVQINIDEVKKDGSNLLINCSAGGDLKKVDLLAALVQKNALINVKAGENNGAKLSHTNVVRSFAKKSAESKTSFNLQLPANITDDNWELIVYAQRKDDLKIVGATEYKHK